MKEYEETHMDGLISIEHEMQPGAFFGDIGIQIAKDGRIWVCIDGRAFLRFSPKKYTNPQRPEKQFRTEIS